MEINPIIIVYEEDPASIGIYRNLSEDFKSKYEFYFCSESPLYLKENFKDKNLVIVLSLHKSEKELPSLTVHSPGNWTNEAILGGEPEKLSYSNPLFNSILLRNIYKIAKDINLKNYEICFEVTHHGPTIDNAVTFVEIGSTKQQWNDEKAQKIIAKALEISLIEYESFKNPENCYVGIGGPHYAPNFTKRCLEGYNIGHIIPKYVMDKINLEKMIPMALERTLFAQGFIIDWKGTTKEIKDFIKNKGYNFIKFK